MRQREAPFPGIAPFHSTLFRSPSSASISPTLLCSQPLNYRRSPHVASRPFFQNPTHACTYHTQQEGALSPTRGLPAPHHPHRQTTKWLDRGDFPILGTFTPPPGLNGTQQLPTTCRSPPTHQSLLVQRAVAGCNVPSVLGGRLTRLNAKTHIKHEAGSGGRSTMFRYFSMWWSI